MNYATLKPYLHFPWDVILLITPETCSLKLHSLVKKTVLNFQKQDSYLDLNRHAQLIYTSTLSKQLVPHRRKYQVDLIEPVTAEAYGVRDLTSMPKLILHCTTSNICYIRHDNNYLTPVDVDAMTRNWWGGKLAQLVWAWGIWPWDRGTNPSHGYSI